MDLLTEILKGLGGEVGKELGQTLDDGINRLILGKDRYERQKKEQQRRMEEQRRKEKKENLILSIIIVTTIAMSFLFGSYGFYISIALLSVISLVLGSETIGGFALFLIIGGIGWFILNK